MWRKYNPNPCGRAVGDCAVRAISKALDIDWEEAYVMLCDSGMAMCDMPSSNSVWGAVLRMHNFRRRNIDGVMTFGEFVSKYYNGTYVLCSGTHVATAINGILYDAWDSSAEHLDFVWIKGD